MIRSIFFAAFLFFISETFAQQFLSPSFSFSHSKTSYLTLTSGKEVQGAISGIDRKKGLIKFIKIKDGSGEKLKLKAEEVQLMYLPPSGLDKLNKAADFLFDAQKWNDEKLEQDLLNQGYVYFELSDVRIKKKTTKLLVQLLNPGFSSVVKVYHDPYAKETMSLGVAGVDVVGGIAKSYFISKDNNPAFLLKKKDYKKEFGVLWKGCDKVINQDTSSDWAELANHIVSFSECKQM